MRSRSIFDKLKRKGQHEEGGVLSSREPTGRQRADCIGIVRFSVLSTVYNKFEDWVQQPFEEYAQVILNEERLRARFQLFEHISLPSYDSQTDKNFLLLVVAPRLLPQRWKEKLADLSASRSYVVVHYADENDFRLSSLTPMIVSDLVRTDRIFSTFRTDDDDAVSARFIERLRAHHQDHFIGYGVSFTSGYYLDLSPKKNRVSIKPRDRKNTGAGLALVSSIDEPVGLFDLSDGHLNYHKLRPVMIDGREPNFVVLNHEFNDTKDRRHSRKHPLSPEEAQRKLKADNFHIDLLGLMAERRQVKATVSVPDRRKTDYASGSGEERINMYWWARKKNFGDLIGPWLVQMITGRQPVNIFNDTSGAVGLLTAGSLIHSMNRPGLDIWGGGAIHPFSKSTVRALRARTPAKIHALRGHLTLREVEKMGWDRPKAFGDPALLLPKFYAPKVKTALLGKVAVLPHYSHKSLFSVAELDDRFHIIEVQDDPKVVIDQIASCAAVVSTSLHGIICAQAYGIPWSWMHMPNTPLRGDRFKFEDFFTVLQRDAVSEIIVDSAEVAPSHLEHAVNRANLPRSTSDVDALLDAFPLNYGLSARS